jgi:glyoxylase-like metal-dependent hydrolase (beta-lactamase superfamily II)
LSGVTPSIHEIAIPTPWDVGPVNVVLIEDDPLTLVDTGPKTDAALEELERALAELGHGVQDIGLVLLTHQHLDHMGMAAMIARRSGADVASLDLVVPYLAHLEEEARRNDEFASHLLRCHGVPAGVVASRPRAARAFTTFGAPVQVTRVLHAGDVVELRDRRLRVLHRPGHSPFDTVYHDEANRVLIAGDHLIAHISSNPMVTGQLTEDGRWTRTRPLVDYLASLKATQGLDVDAVLTGHGAPIFGHRDLIDERLRHHQARLAAIQAILAERPRTAYEVAQEIWGDVAGTQAFLTISEVLGHVDLLLDAGVAERRKAGATVQFVATPRSRAQSAYSDDQYV